MSCRTALRPGGAPTVLASGEGHIARLIKERADAAGIPMVEDPKLSYLLSKIPLGDEIPPELYRAVAEVLVCFAYGAEEITA